MPLGCRCAAAADAAADAVRSCAAVKKGIGDILWTSVLTEGSDRKLTTKGAKHMDKKIKGEGNNIRPQ
ncbi:hypothetical protein CYMTET_43104 [Cymbomonas tetramitiformis]|uniref:Uncharacterized protein n=1 Tax=Cymbomonas tetramitiformis TaxID=36881 RepID=A0AAE0C2P7_9CHLO|nr:hypothetical protein CYMTET_43104 [Cymbomonas tetramitiformis]